MPDGFWHRVDARLNRTVEVLKRTELEKIPTQEFLAEPHQEPAGSDAGHTRAA